MESSIGIKAAKTGKNQNLKKKNGKTYDAENSPTCRGSEIYQQKCQIKKKKKTPKKTKKRKLMVRTTHQHAEEVTYKV